MPHLTETEAVGGSLQINMEQKNLGGLLLAGRGTVEARQEGHGKGIRGNQDVEATDKLPQRQIVGIALSVQPDGRQ